MTLETAIGADETADPHRRRSDGQTPLMIAAGLGRPQTVELLLAAGADVLTAEPLMGATALHKAAQSGDVEVIGRLLDQGALVDQQSARLGHTPLMDAVQHKHEAAVRLLLARGARATIRNHWHETALDLARQDGSDVRAGLLQAHESARVRGWPLPAAVKAGDLAQVERLIAAGEPEDPVEQGSVGGQGDRRPEQAGGAVAKR